VLAPAAVTCLARPAAVTCLGRRAAVARLASVTLREAPAGAAKQAPGRPVATPDPVPAHPVVAAGPGVAERPAAVLAVAAYPSRLGWSRLRLA
jgi:hypothetical protein